MKTLVLVVSVNVKDEEESEKIMSNAFHKDGVSINLPGLHESLIEHGWANLIHVEHYLSEEHE